MVRKLAVLAAVLAVFAAACSGTSSDENIEDTGPAVGLEVGDIAPDISFTDLEGNERKLSDFRGRVVFLNFWATWCPPCIYEMPSMEEMYQDYKNEEFIILAISVGGYGETKADVEEFMDEFGLTFPVFLDYKHTAFKELQKTSGIPQTYIIDKDGIIREWVPGTRDWAPLVNRSSILQILKEK